MKFLCHIVPNLCISLNIAMMIVIYLDMRNPMMGFLVGTPFAVLAVSSCITSIVTGIVLYGSCRKKQNRSSSAEKNLE